MEPRRGAPYSKDRCPVCRARARGMSTKRIRRKKALRQGLSYRRSAIAVPLLLLALLLCWAALSEPRTGTIRNPRLAALAFAAVAVLVPMFLYADYRSQNRRPKLGDSRGFRALSLWTDHGTD